jgi:hypothetical protein
MIALAKRLPDEIIDVFSDEEHADKLHYITGRKLRPITLLKTDAEKIFLNFCKFNLKRIPHHRILDNFR